MVGRLVFKGLFWNLVTLISLSVFVFRQLGLSRIELIVFIRTQSSGQHTLEINMLSYANPYCFTEPNKNNSIILLIPLQQYGGHSWGVKRQLTIQTNPVRSQVYSYKEPALPTCSGRCCASEDGLVPRLRGIKDSLHLSSKVIYFTILMAWFYPKLNVLIFLSPFFCKELFFICTYGSAHQQFLSK